VMLHVNRSVPAVRGKNENVRLADSSTEQVRGQAASQNDRDTLGHRFERRSDYVLSGLARRHKRNFTDVDDFRRNRLIELLATVDTPLNFLGRGDWGTRHEHIVLGADRTALRNVGSLKRNQ
jgi:hypothetical protein